MRHLSHLSPVFSLILVAVLSSFADAQITRVGDWPGITNLRSCVTCIFQVGFCNGYNVLGSLGCSTWSCVCDHFPDALNIVSSSASVGCSNTQDIASATSVLNGFCAQLSLMTPVASISAVNSPTGQGVGGGQATMTQTVARPPVTVTLTPSFITRTSQQLVTTTDSNGQVTSFTTTVVDTVPVVTTTDTYGLSQSDKIALGIGLGIGVPSCIAAIWGLIHRRNNQTPPPYVPQNGGHGYGSDGGQFPVAGEQLSGKVEREDGGANKPSGNLFINQDYGGY